MYKRTWILVEGKDDTRFVNAVLRPILQENRDFVGTWEYAQETPKKIIGFLRAIKSMNAECLLLADINDSPCVSAKKEGLTQNLRQALEPADAVVVVREIESWCMAGLDDDSCREFRIENVSATDEVTKEQFRDLMPSRFHDSLVDFMAELLNVFRVDMARAKNRSFCYLTDLLEARSRET